MYKCYFVMVFLAIWIAMAFADDFAIAREKINKAKPDIDYSTFCSEMPAGEDKIACRIKNVSTVGFLVCQKSEIDDVDCSTVIKNEVENIQTIQREGNVKTVKISPPPIGDVRCGKDPSLNCSGFLEEWVAPEAGRFKQVRDHISNKTVPKLITDVKSFTSKAGLSTTAADLSNIKKYMMENPKGNKYRQICDLQGFFLVNGGFLINDVPYILKDASIDGVCWNDEPTTKQVLDALDEMISAFGDGVKNTTFVNGGINITGPHFNVKILLIGVLYFIVAPIASI